MPNCLRTTTLRRGQRGLRGPRPAHARAQRHRQGISLVRLRQTPARRRLRRQPQGQVRHETRAHMLCTYATTYYYPRGARWWGERQIAKGLNFTRALSRRNERLLLHKNKKPIQSFCFRFGYSPLHIAALNEYSYCANMLLAYGADITARTNGGSSALSMIVRKIPNVLPKFEDMLDHAITLVTIFCLTSRDQVTLSGRARHQ